MLDILAHAVVAIAATILTDIFCPWPYAPWGMAFAGLVIWVLREGWQNWGKWGNWFTTWSQQKKLEAIVPSVAGLVTAAILWAIG